MKALRLAATLMFVIAGCASGAADDPVIAPAATTQTCTPAPCGSGSLKVCTTTDGTGACRGVTYTTPDGKAFACNSCQDCAQAATNVAQACAGPTTEVSGTGSAPQPGSGDDAGSSGAGSGEDAGPNATCNACIAAEQSGAGICAGTVADCQGSPTCEELITCLNACTTMSCSQACVDAASTTDVDSLQAVQQCLCDACATPCASECAAAAGGGGGSGGSCDPTSCTGCYPASDGMGGTQECCASCGATGCETTCS